MCCYTFTNMGTPSPGRRIAYARVSTIDQNPALQMDALEGQADQIHVEYASARAGATRPVLEQVLRSLRPGDTLVAWRFDRLFRSLRDLLNLVHDLQERGIELRTLHEGIDTSTPMGLAMLGLFGFIGEFERALLIERTQAGLAAARARGRKGGRPFILKGERLRQAITLYESREHTGREIAAQLHISRATLYRALHRHALSSHASVPSPAV